MHKYGRDFSAAVMENKDGCVSERVRIISDCCLFIFVSRSMLLGDQEAVYADPVSPVSRCVSG
jgi:hypothetical protein